MIKHTLTAFALAVLIAAGLLYPLLALSFGTDPRTWPAQIDAQNEAAKHAEIDACRALIEQEG